MIKETTQNIICDTCRKIITTEPHYTITGKQGQIMHYCVTDIKASGHIPDAVFFSPALVEKSKHYPANFGSRVPLKVRMAKTVRDDSIAIRTIPAVVGKEYYCFVNSNGEVAVLLPQKLGVKPDEFLVIEWHP